MEQMGIVKAFGKSETKYSLSQVEFLDFVTKLKDFDPALASSLQKGFTVEEKVFIGDVSTFIGYLHLQEAQRAVKQTTGDEIPILAKKLLEEAVQIYDSNSTAEICNEHVQNMVD
jgi:hypothetical protein